MQLKIRYSPPDVESGGAKKNGIEERGFFLPSGPSMEGERKLDSCRRNIVKA